MDTTTEASRGDFAAVRNAVSTANRSGAINGSASTRYVSSHAPPPPPPPLPPHISSLHSHHIHHLHHSGTSAATAGLLMTPSAMLDSSVTASDGVHHYGQSPGTTNNSRTGVPHEIGRPGPPHATPAASVSAPSPLPPMQCQDRFFSSLTINTGSNYAFLNGVPAPTFTAASIHAPMSASSPFRTPPGLANVHNHWSHTPPPSPLENYGRYGLAPSIYSLYPMLTGNDANALCLQASAAKLLQRASSYYPVLDRSRDFGMYHPANFPIGSPFSPSISTLDGGDLSGSANSTVGSLPDFLQQRFAATTTSLDYICKTSNSNFGGSTNSGVNKFSAARSSAGSIVNTEDEKSKKSSSSSVKEARSKNNSSNSSSSNTKSVSVNGKMSVDSRAPPPPSLPSPKDQTINGNSGESRGCVAASEPSIVKKESRNSDSCRKKQSTLKNTCVSAPDVGGSAGGLAAGIVLPPIVNDVSQVQALNLSQDIKKSSSKGSTSATTPICSKASIDDYARVYGTTFFPFDPTLSLRLSSSSTTTSVSPRLLTTQAQTAASNVCDKNIRVKVEPEIKGSQRAQCSYQNELLRSASEIEKHSQDRSPLNSKLPYSANGLNGLDVKSGDCHVLNLMTHQHNNNQRDDHLCSAKDVSSSVELGDNCQQPTVAPAKKCFTEDKKQRTSTKLMNEELRSKKSNSSEKSHLGLSAANRGKEALSPTPGVSVTDIVNVDESISNKSTDIKSTTMKDENLSKVAVKGSHIESITNKLLAKSQLGVYSDSSSKSSSVTQLQVPQHSKCRRKSLIVDKMMNQNESETKHSNITQSSTTANEGSCLRLPVQAAPYDYTLKQQSCNGTFTVTTTSPVTPTTTTMALQQISSGSTPSSSSSSSQRCFTEHAHKSVVTAIPAISADLNMSESSLSSSAESSSSSSPINVTDIDSSPSTKFKSSAQSSEDKVLLKFASKGNGVDVQLFDRKMRSKLASAHESNSNLSLDGVSTIPVGIAVAQQRQEGQPQSKQRSESLSCKQGVQKCVASSASPIPSKSNEILSPNKSRQISNDLMIENNKMVCFDKSSSSDDPAAVTSASDFTPSLMIAGAAPLTTSCWAGDDKARWFSSGHPALWLGQSSYAGASTSLSMQLGSADHLAASLPPHPTSHSFPPIGYQLARDPITNHLFLIPTPNINLMDRSPLWPAAPPATQIPTLHKPFQSCIFPPSLPPAITTSSSSVPLQQVTSPIITANRLTQERQHYDCKYLSETDKALNISNINVPASQIVPDAATEILSVKSSILKGEDDDKRIINSTLSGPTASNSQPYCFDVPSNVASLASDAVVVSRTASPSLSCPCHVSSVESKVVVEGEPLVQQQLVDVGNTLKTEVTKMADACNQTETPPLTDEEEEENSKDFNAICHPLYTSSSSEVKDVSSNVSSVIKVEDMSVQCELADETEMLVEEKKEDLNVHGLELLSKTIAESNLEAASDLPRSSPISKTETESDQSVNCNVSEFKLSQCDQSESLAAHEEFGGLGLLCALAEQRILQESSTITSSSDAIINTVKDDLSDVSYKIPKTNKEYRHFIAQKMSQYSSSSSSSSTSSPSSNSLTCSKSLTDNESANETDSVEIKMRLKLADLQKKYKEKQKELAKLARKDSDHSKRKPGRPKKGKKSAKSSFKFNHQLHCAKLSLTSCHKKNSPSSTPSVTSEKSTELSNEPSSSMVAASNSRPILNHSNLVTSTPKNMSTLDKWTSSLAACPPSLFQLVPTLKKCPTNGVSKSTIFTNLKQQLPAPLSSSGPLTTKLSMATSSKSTVPEVSSPNKGQTTTPDETTTETSDSDDSSLYQSNKAKSKPSTTKSRTTNPSRDQQRLGNCRRKETLFKNSSNSKSRNLLSDDQRDDSHSAAEVEQLSLSFMQTGSLSVSCTMPPFKGQVDKVEEVKEEGDAAVANDDDETSCGLGLLATCATQATTFESAPLLGSPVDQLTTTESSDQFPIDETKEGGESKTSTSSTSDTPIDETKNVTNVEGSEKEEEQSTPSTTTTKCKYSYLEDEAWLRRRSERIFLSELTCRNQTHFKSSFQTHNESIINKHKPSVSSVPSSTSTTNNSNISNGGGVSREITVSAAVSAVAAVTGLTWKPRSDENKSLKKRSNKTKVESEPAVKKIKVNPTAFTKILIPARSEPEASLDKNHTCQFSSESDSDSPAETSSYSEGDNLPLSKLVDRSVTPAPRSCIIQAEELRDNQRVLTMIDRLFYAGRVVAIRAPDVYGITVDGERGNRPHIYSREEILQEAVMDVKPGSKRYLPEGTRVCAYWSQQYRCLYPGTVAKSTSPSSSPESEDSILVEFDDGDSGRISVDNIRLLPSDLPIISYDRDPLNIGKRRTKSTGDIAQEKRTPIASISENHKEHSRSADKLKLHSEEILSLKSKEALNESSSANISLAQRKLFEITKKVDGKKINDEVNNNDSNSQSKLSDLCRIPLVKALYGSQILSATVSVVPLSRSSTPTSSTGSTISSCGKAIRNLGAGFSSSTSSSLLKSRKHKKHKNSKNDNKKRHHRHHRRHRHKHKHEKNQDSAFRDHNNEKSVKNENADENQLVDGNLEGKKQDLTLKIRTTVKVNRTEINRKESTEDEKNWNDENKSCFSEQVLSINKADTKLNLIDEPLPPRKAKTAKKEETSVNSSRPKAKRKERSNSVETKSKIAAFLPARQLWRWSGKSFRRPGAKGKAKKDFYKAITRGKETIRVGDSAVFLSTGRPHLPFIGRIITMWESWGGNMIVKVRWFYHPEETKGGKKLVFNKGALYQSYHIDENDVQTISHKCEVLSWSDYRKYKDQDGNSSSGSFLYDNCDVYYLAGSYDPTAGVVTLEEGVS